MKQLVGDMKEMGSGLIITADNFSAFNSVLVDRGMDIIQTKLPFKFMFMKKLKSIFRCPRVLNIDLGWGHVENVRAETGFMQGGVESPFL